MNFVLFQGTLAIMQSSYRDHSLLRKDTGWNFRDFTFVNNLKLRGFERVSEDDIGSSRDDLPGFHFRDDGFRIWDIVDEYVRLHLAQIYGDDCRPRDDGSGTLANVAECNKAIRADEALQELHFELSNEFGANIAGEVRRMAPESTPRWWQTSGSSQFSLTISAAADIFTVFFPCIRCRRSTLALASCGNSWLPLCSTVVLSTRRSTLGRSDLRHTAGQFLFAQVYFAVFCCDMLQLKHALFSCWYIEVIHCGVSDCLTLVVRDPSVPVNWRTIGMPVDCWSLPDYRSPLRVMSDEPAIGLLPLAAAVSLAGLPTSKAHAARLLGGRPADTDGAAHGDGHVG